MSSSAETPNKAAAPKETGCTVLLYDGVCGLCNNVVQFVLPRDHKQQFYFASLQSEYAHGILQRYGKNSDVLSTVYCLENANTADEKLHSKSRAVICVVSKLGFPLSLVSIGIILPSFVRDALYDFVATNRYKWFGKHDVCLAPTSQDKERFLG